MKIVIRSLVILLLFLICSSNGFALHPQQSGINDSAKHKKAKAKRFHENQLLIKFTHKAERMRKRGGNTSGIKRLKKKGKLRMKRLAKRLKRKSKSGFERWHKIDLPEGLNFKEAKKMLENDPDIEYVEPNYLVSIQQLPSDPRFDELWGLENTGQTGGIAEADISAKEAWDITTGSSNVTVAVIDTGIDYNHPDLANNMWVNKGEIPNNGIDDDGNGYVDDYHGYDFVNYDGDPYDDHGHGTHVSGTIAATANNGIGVAGVSWSSRIMALKFMDANGTGTTAAAVAAINYATAMGAKISNNSWGAWSPLVPQALIDAISAANDAGSIFVAAAGNANTDVNTTPIIPARIALPNVIAVAATDSNDDLAWFSNYGSTTIHLGAPGVDIFSTLPPKRLCTKTSICVTNGYGKFSGTSMAAPHVAGAAALLKSRFPNLSIVEIKNRLINTVDIIPALSSNTVSGGRLNIAKALNMVAHTVNFNSGLNQISRQSTITLSLNLTSNADEVLNLSLEPLPSGITASLSANQVPLASGSSTNVTVTIQTDDTINRTMVPIRVLSTGSESIVSVAETMLQVLVSDFDLIATPAMNYVTPGNSINVELGLESFDTSGLVDLAVSSSSGIGAQLLSSTEMLPLNGSVTTILNVTPTNGIVPGVYDIPVTATMGGVSKTIEIQINVIDVDLVPTNISTSINAIDLAESFLIIYSISNNGLSSTAGSFRVGYYLSTDSTIDKNDMLLDSRDLSILGAGVSRNFNSTLTIPYNTNLGDYYLGLIVDDLNTEVETNENNNMLATVVSVVVETDVCSSSCDFNTIQDAIDAAPVDGIIVVREGSYFEAIVMGENKTLFGIDGPEKTIIDATALDSSVISLVNNSAHIEGFTLRGGNSDIGGGISVSDGVVTIRNNIIHNNIASIRGSAVGGGSNYTRVSLIDNVISDNLSLGDLGTVSVGGLKEVRNNIFNNNQVPDGKGGGLVVSWDGINMSIVDRNTFIGNSAMFGGAIYFPKYTRAVVSNSLIAKNSAIEGAGIYGDDYSNGNRILNSTIVDNQGTALGRGTYGGRLWTMENSIVYGNTGGIGWPIPYLNSITSGDGVDPMFVDYAAGNYRLAAGSPAIDSGGDFGPSTDYWGNPYDHKKDLDGKIRPLDGDSLGAGTTGDGSDYDMGAYEFVDTSLPIADMPDISPSGGEFYGSVTVTLSSSIPGATIYYTLDGSTPSPVNGILYTGPILLKNSLVINAITITVDHQDSSVSSAAFTILDELLDIDLLPTDIYTSATSVRSGQSFDLGYSLVNDGLSATMGDFRVGYYLSDDEFIDSNDQLIGSQTINRLNSGEATSSIVFVTLPNYIIPKNYYVGIVVDDLDVEEETDETNNSMANGMISILAEADVCPLNCPFSSIQTAIDATAKNGTIIVGAGIYYEAIILGDNKTLLAINGPEDTVIDATGLNTSVIRLINYSAHIEGFTLQGGNSTHGGGIYVNNGIVTIKNNIIQDNIASNAGSAIGGGSTYYAKVYLFDNVFANNISTGVWGAVSVGGIRQVNGNSFLNNQVPNGNGGGLVLLGSRQDPALIDRNIFTGNSAARGGAIYVPAYTPATISNTLIADNSGADGAGIYASSRAYGVRIVNSTIANNDGVGIHIMNYAGRNWRLESSIVHGNSGGNIVTARYSYGVRKYSSMTYDTVDPMFMDPDAGNYRLVAGSPAIDTGANFGSPTDSSGNPYDISVDLDGNSRPMDGDGLGVGSTGDGSDYDMGAFEFVESLQ